LRFRKGDKVQVVKLDELTRAIYGNIEGAIGKVEDVKKHGRTTIVWVQFGSPIGRAALKASQLKKLRDLKVIFVRKPKEGTLYPTIYDSPFWAESVADKLREKGYNVRVIQTSRGFRIQFLKHKKRR